MRVTSPGAPRRSPPTDGDSAPKVPLARRFTVRYLVALGLVLVLCLVGRQIVEGNLASVTLANQRLRIASEQPVRVHQIVDAAEALDVANAAGDTLAAEDARNRLAQESDALRRAQRALIEGDESLGMDRGPLLGPRIRELFLGSGRLDQRLSSFASNAQVLATFSDEDQQGPEAQALQVLRDEEAILITDLQTAVRLFNERIAVEIAEQHRANDQLLLAAVLVVGTCGLILFRPMARSIRVETSALEEAERRHRESSERQTFRTELSQAMELCTEEGEVIATAERALADIVEQPSDLLLVDAARSHIHRGGAHPLAGAAACPVETAEACAALRSGQTRYYPSSRQLNVCPKVPQHEAAPCSAVCIPMVFNGDAVGVVHTIGPDGTLPDETATERLQVLSEEISRRLGTLRITKTTRRLAERDALTDLDNRRTLLDKATTLIEQDRPFSLAVADLDHFKDLNDTYGHEMGDRALQLFADSLRTYLRPEDVVARYGGEEFVVVLPGTPIHDATRAIERLQSALGDEIRLRNAVAFTASWGLTDSSSGATFQEMLNVADQAMYDAKRAGRNCLVVDGDAAARASRAAQRHSDGEGTIDDASGGTGSVTAAGAGPQEADGRAAGPGDDAVADTGTGTTTH